MQVLSLVGSLFLLLGYLLLVLGKISNKRPFFHIMNLIGCVILAITLWFDAFNLGSFVLQVVFAGIALWAIIKTY